MEQQPSDLTLLTTKINSNFLACLDSVLSSASPSSSTGQSSSLGDEGGRLEQSSSSASTSLETNINNFLESAKLLETEFAQLYQRFNSNSDARLLKVIHFF